MVEFEKTIEDKKRPCDEHKQQNQEDPRCQSPEQAIRADVLLTDVEVVVAKATFTIDLPCAENLCSDAVDMGRAVALARSYKRGRNANVL